MPLDVHHIMASSKTIEARKLKIGQTGSRSPDKLKGIAITHSLKPSGGKNFDKDYPIMQSVFEHYGNKGDVGTTLPRVPVRLFSDNINEIVHVYRGWWARSGPRCLSGIGKEMAARYFDQKEFEKNNNIVKVFPPVEYKCDDKCPMWGKDGEKTDCKWTAIVSMQLEHFPVFPSPTQFRTTGMQIIKSMVGSLNMIKEATGGILAGIPLEFCWHEVEGGTRDGKKRKYPVMTFEFSGTLQQLREQAILEMESRRRLKSAHKGVPVDAEIKPQSMSGFTTDVMVASVSEDASESGEEDEYIPDDDDNEPAAPSVSQEDELRQAKIKKLQSDLGMTDKAVDMMLDKHGGDFDSAIAEMKSMTPAGDFAPGEMSDEDFVPEEEEEEEEQESAEAQAPGDLFEDDSFIFED